MIIAKIVHTDIHLIAANILVMFFIFTLFFAFLEIGKKVGNASLFHWFFG
jgi:hypothetical protein